MHTHTTHFARTHTRRRGMAMLVIVAILAALFTMGWTLFLFMQIESRSGENLTNSARAQGDANAMIEKATEVLFYSDRSYDAKVPGIAWWEFEDGDTTATDGNPAVDIYDLDARFNISAMGNPADLGADGVNWQRFTSFENSLARVLMSAIKTTHYDETSDAVSHRRFCLCLAREITERRYGPARSPSADPVTDPQGDLGTIPMPGSAGNDVMLGHIWGVTATAGWTFGTDDVGIAYPADTNDANEAGYKDGYANYYSHDSSGTLASYVEPGVWQTRDSGANFNDDELGATDGTNYLPTADGGTYDMGEKDFLPSYLRNESGTVFNETNVALFGDPTNDSTEYDPHHPLSNDRPYTTVLEVPAIIRHVLTQYENPYLVAIGSTALTNAEVEAEVSEIYADIKDYICVHSHNRRAESPRNATTAPPTACVSINDWSSDRIDNDDDGLVDEDNEGFTPQLLRAKLGLDALVAATTISQKEANQIVANIIDARDADDTPTLVETIAGTGDADDAYGMEGLHLTEIMGEPDAYDQTTNNGLEMQHDGGAAGVVAVTDAANWDWIPAGSLWQQLDAAQQTATFTFNGFPNGYYALRVYSDTQNTVLDFSLDNTTFYNVVCSRGTGPYYGYVRTAAGNPLFTVPVAGNSLTFYIRGAMGVKFQTIQLLPQYVEITNTAMRSPAVSGDQGIALTGYTLEIGSKTITIPADCAKAWDAGAGAQASDIETIPAAHGNGQYPIDYGYFVIAMSEDAYDKNYGDGSGSWGDVNTESYPVYFLGDVSDDNADLLDFVRTNLSVTLSNSGGDLIAGGDIDASTALNLEQYSSIEKRELASNANGWADRENGAGIPTNLSSSQNWSITANAASIRTNLNKRYDELYSASAVMKTPAALAAEYRTLPFVLNRPYASPGWLGLVPSGTAWRTMDPDPDPSTAAIAGPEELLGFLMTRAVTGGDYARINVNTASVHVLKSMFSDTVATRIEAAGPWTSWDALLTDSIFTTYAASGDPGYFGDGIEDSGVGSFRDDYVDDSDEKEELLRRFSGQIDIRSSAFLVRVRGRWNPDPAAGPGPTDAVSVVEAVINRDGDLDGDGVADCARVEFRYVTEQP